MPDPDSKWYQPMHNAGMEMLKQKMWQNLGVDYTPGYQHMDDSQTYDDRARGVINQGKPDVRSLQYYQQQMENESGKSKLEGSMDRTPQPIALHPMASALQGQQDPAMSGLFGVPSQHLQQLAGDVITPNPHQFGPNVYTDDYWNRVSQPGGYANPAVTNPVAQGVMSGKIKVLNPAGK